MAEPLTLSIYIYSILNENSSAHYSIHSLRHTYATNLYKASGYNLRLVQRQLGHSSPTVTQVYADVMDSDVEEALRNMESDKE
ncbi:hypothetical protein E3V33_05110 [Candidatus Marinimicrobia bacterium MT.SAG.4]|nr:hypothetical protein E3V33_05070 [Candidatus Marinimicrobia bacterium MT.SAG.4]TFB12623.1 hypothetical protein E3V33_05110 [Candidatus Marinimicrobia bacterium MT.SAG.4]